MGFWDQFKARSVQATTVTPSSSLYDRTLLWLYLILLLIGLLAVSSASIPVGTRLYSDAFYFAKRDVLYIILSCVTCYFALQIPMGKWEKWHVKLFGVALVLLFLVMIPGIGREVNGARRWIPMVLFNFQPAEFAKLVQPDLGSAVVLFIITFGLLFIVGANFWQFIGLIGVGLLLFVWLVLTSAYRLKRITGFMDPFKDPYGTGFQLSNSLMAFGRGGFFGEGLGNSVLKLEYLPEAHTDFVMAIVGEEFGFFGIFIIITLLGLLVFRAMKIGRESLILEQRFKGFLAFGISFWIFFQGFVNLGMALGMLPTKGLTFPLVSYGGSSIIIMSVTIGMLLRIDHENRLMRGGQARLRDD